MVNDVVKKTDYRESRLVINMSASHSLIALVNQLQAMESSLASIIFESVAKLSSLTSSSVFLLIETDDGNRRFSGSQHLREAFMNGALAASPKDMQVRPFRSI